MFIEDLFHYLDSNCIEYEKDFKIASYVSIRIGGIAFAIVYPDSTQKLCDLIKYINGKIKYYLLGNGTNCYFSEIYDGIIISTKNLTKLQLLGNEIIAECGVSLSECAMFACENSLTGIEFIYGIPGSVGGGVYMNASAYGGMISDCVKECTVYDISKNEICVLNKENLLFDVKKSIFADKNYILLNTAFELKSDNKTAINKKMNEYLNKRIVSQPLNLPSAGSVFKRPKNAYASLLIDNAGLKGFRVGDAEVSRKHAGFIVNLGNANATDINSLICKIKKIVKDKYDVELEEEIIFVE